jgi:predicted DsbA family dithiol-disulfide isomerase
MDEIVVDVVSDVVCPWCYLGKARLEQAMDQVKDEINVKVTWRPYQLNPDIPKEGVDHHAYLAAKLGGAERVKKAHEMLTGLGHEAGIRYNFDAIRIGPNTLDAHRLIHWALVEGPEIHDKVTTALFKANFEEGRNIGDHAVLADIAEKAGMDRAVVERLLASDADVDTVKTEIQSAQRMGVSGVPFFIIDQKYGISGAQTADVLAEALKDIARTKRDAAE